MQSISHLPRTVEDGFEAHGVTDNGVKGHIPILEARAAAVAPTGTEPGYFLILGQKLERLPNGKRPLLFLAEGLNDNQSKLLKKLSDDARRLNVRNVYVREGTGFHQAAWEQFSGAPGIGVVPAPFPEDLEYGLAMIREWLLDRALDIPDARFQQTELRQQIEKATKSSQGYVVETLRFLIGGFTRWAPRRAGNVQAKRVSYFYG